MSNKDKDVPNGPSADWIWNAAEKYQSEVQTCYDSDSSDHASGFAAGAQWAIEWFRALERTKNEESK